MTATSYTMHEKKLVLHLLADYETLNGTVDSKILLRLQDILSKTMNIPNEAISAHQEHLAQASLEKRVAPVSSTTSGKNISSLGITRTTKVEVAKLFADDVAAMQDDPGFSGSKDAIELLKGVLHD